MKTITIITSYFLMLSGIIMAVSGIFIAFGLATLSSGISTSGFQSSVFTGVFNIIAITTCGKLFVEGLYLCSFVNIKLFFIFILAFIFVETTNSIHIKLSINKFISPFSSLKEFD